MNETTTALAVEASGYETTRFNALRHGVLSRSTVLRALLDALVAEHAPQGPTEEHLVEELAGMLWRKRRLRLAEAAAYHRGLEGTLEPYRETISPSFSTHPKNRRFFWARTSVSRINTGGPV